MDVQQFELGYSLAFGTLFIAGLSAWGLSTIIKFFTKLSGG